MTGRGWNWVIVPVLGIGLFFGTIAGLLLIQGRFDYEGTRDMPLLSWMFEPPASDVVEPPDARDEPLEDPAPAPLAETGAAPAASPRSAPRGTADEPAPFDIDLISPLLAGPDGALLLKAARIEELHREAERRRDESETLRRSLDERESELLIRERDLAERQRRIGMLMARMEDERKRLDARLRQFEADVRLVRETELDAIYDYARFLVGVDPRTAAEQIEIAWRSEEGQDMVVTAVAQMTPDEARRVLRELAAERVYEIRMRCFDVITEEPSRGQAQTGEQRR